MGILSKLLGGGVKELANGIGGAIDRFVETPDEKRAAELLKVKMAQNAAKWQVEVNKIEAGHRSLFVAGWRPMIGWICALSLGWGWILRPIVQSVLIMVGKTVELPAIEVQEAIGLATVLLGVAGIRSYDKKQGITN